MQKTASRGMGLWLAASLAACSTALPQAPAAKTVYDFGPVLPTANVTSASSTTASITVADVEAVSALAGNAMLYRLGYANAQQLLPYTQARWSMSPAQLVQQRLLQRLSGSRVVLSSGQGANAPLLRIELQEFSHYFDSAQASKALVRARATLTSAQGQLLAQRSFATESPAPSTDAAGGAAALAKASDELVAQIEAWLPR